MSTSAVALTLALAPTAAAQEQAALASERSSLDAIVITGSKQKALEIGSSVTFLDTSDLEKFSYADVNRVLRQAPGVYLREEEGFGLRPNISIRGSYDDRNSKIALYEDGVLMAPAPYAAPSAYYFPSIGRMSGVEIVKGAGAIKYGPHTAGGAVHLFSTPIPDTVDRISGKLKLIAGEHGTLRGHGMAGGYTRLGAYDLGASFETYQDRSSGFKELDNGGPTGYSVEDYVGKIALRSTDAAGIQQSLELKFGYYRQHSDETYLGLSTADFGLTPLRRYRGSQEDEIDVQHRTYQLTHNIWFGEGWGLTTVGYRTGTHRVWYKLQDVRNAGGQDRGLGAVLGDPTAANNATAFAYLTGADSPVNALRVRNNDRKYETTGVQSVLTKDLVAGGMEHGMEFSVRYHEDEEDRFQQDDRFTMVNGTMVLSSAGMPGSNANQNDAARAWSFFVRDTITWGDFGLTPGVRYESIVLKRTRYTSDAASIGRGNRGALRDAGSEKTDIWLPGVSATYDVGQDFTLLAGVHRGFTNPAPVNAGGTLAKPEQSTNSEVGVRYQYEAAQVSLIGFFNNYSNFVGTCTASSGGGCVIGDQFSGGRVHAKGIEVTAAYDAGPALGAGLSVPLGVIYSYTHGTFRDSLNSFGPWA